MRPRGIHTYVVGLIDDVRIYDRALAQSDIRTDLDSPVAGP